MNRTLRNGALVGAVGGMMMAMWSMVVMAVIGNGFWTPVNAIAHTFWDGAPLDGGFDGGAAALGVAAHMAVSMMLGAFVATAASRLSSVTTRIAVAASAPIAAWVAQLIVWDALDSAAQDVFTPWVLFTGHVVYAMVAVAGVRLTASVGATTGERLSGRPVAAAR